MSRKKKSFEQSMSRLQEISELLESDDVSLEDSIKIYEEGIKLSEECFKALQDAELKVVELNKDLENKLDN